MAYLVCENLSIGYAGHVVAREISFSVDSGDMLCVVGENGAGKSTLVKTLLGLMEPLSGELSFGDGLTQDEVGYLPQRGETQRDFPASSWEIVLSGRLSRIGARPFYNKADRRIAAEMLERVDAADLRDTPFGHLSGGQQQRIMLARALCAASKLIVLDEPTTGLDPEAAKSLYGVLDSLRGDGMAIIAVSHDVDEALEHATHVLSFRGGAPRFAPVAAYLEGEMMLP